MDQFLTGVLQGATEFLPVSSSGHLFLARNVFSLNFGTEYVVLLHLGTLIAVLLFFWKDIRDILVGLFKRDFKYWKLALSLIVATIPAAIFGLLFKDYIEQHMTNSVFVGICLFVTGVVVFLTDRVKTSKFGIEDIGIKLALIIGIFQAIAILPGISRSGFTLACALLLGIKREDAFKFSFLLSIPVILGGSIFEMSGGLQFFDGIVGFLSAACVGFLALFILKKLMQISQLKYFSFYCWIMGFIAIILG